MPYFKEKLIKELFKNIRENFQGCEMVFDTQSKLGNFISNTGLKFSGMKSAILEWGIKDSSKIENWFGGIKLQQEYPLFSRTERLEERGSINRIMDFSDRFKLANIVSLRFLKEEF
ncbi:MAG: hypothetical protein ABSG94_11950 [Brevinematales bacterium]